MLQKIKNILKSNFFTNFKIILLAFFSAILVNYILLDGSIIKNKISSSILDTQMKTSTTIEKTADIWFTKTNDSIEINFSNKIKIPNTIGFSLVYNPENVNILKIISNIGEISNISNTKGINSILVNIDLNKINQIDKKITVLINKNQDTPENINIINANFIDIENKQYSLSTSGLTF